MTFQLEERLKTYMQENQQRDILISPEMFTCRKTSSGTS